MRRTINRPGTWSALGWAANAVNVISATSAREIHCPDASSKTASARRFPAWSGKRSFSGWYWCRTTGSMVPFESLLEREAVVVFDFDPSVVEIVAQPFALLWPLLQDGAA
jgi:hypothetical protein